MLSHTLLLLEFGRAAQPQLELYRSPPPAGINEDDEVVKESRFLKTRLFNVAEVIWQFLLFFFVIDRATRAPTGHLFPDFRGNFTEGGQALQLVTMKLHVYHATDHREPWLGK